MGGGILKVCYFSSREKAIKNTQPESILQSCHGKHSFKAPPQMEKWNAGLARGSEAYVLCSRKQHKDVVMRLAAKGIYFKSTLGHMKKPDSTFLVPCLLVAGHKI